MKTGQTGARLSLPTSTPEAAMTLAPRINPNRPADRTLDRAGHTLGSGRISPPVWVLHLYPDRRIRCLHSVGLHGLRTTPGRDHLDNLFRPDRHRLQPADPDLFEEADVDVHRRRCRRRHPRAPAQC